MAWTVTAEQLVSALIGFFSVSGMVVYGLKKNGLVSFGADNKERRACKAETCEEHKMMMESVKVLFDRFNSMDKKLDGVAENVQHISGWIEGAHGLSRRGK